MDLIQIRPYKPEHSFEWGPLIQLFAAMAAVGALVGVVGALISQWIYLIILFPIVMGLAVGAIGVKIIGAMKIRDGVSVAAAASLAGLVCAAAMHFGEYYSARVEIDRAIKESPDLDSFVQRPPGERLQLAAGLETEQQRTDARGFSDLYESTRSFPAYLEHAARMGVSLKSSHSLHDDGINLGYMGTWIYWLVDALIVCFMAASMVWERARQPFCKPANQWKTAAAYLLRGEPAETEAALKAGDLSRLKAVIARTDGEIKHGIKVFTSPRLDPRSSVDIKLFQLQTNRKGKVTEKTLDFFSIPGEALTQVQEVMQAFPAKSS